MIIIDQRNQTASLYEIQVRVIYSRTIFATVMSECCVKRVISKTLTGTPENSADPEQMPQNVASEQGLHCLLKLQEIKG